jgi:hypothetical protein
MASYVAFQEKPDARNRLQESLSEVKESQKKRPKPGTVVDKYYSN